MGLNKFSLTQKIMAALYDVPISAINRHLKRIFSDNELKDASMIFHGPATGRYLSSESQVISGTLL